MQAPRLCNGCSYVSQGRHEVFCTELVSNAFLLAAKAHEGQNRKDGSSQLSHSVLVGLQVCVQLVLFLPGTD